PGVVVLLAGRGNRAKRPNQLARSHVPCAHVPGGTARWVLLRRSASDDQVLEDGRRRAEPVAAWKSAQDFRRVEIDDAPGAERFGGFARLRVQGVQLAVVGAEDD